MSNTQPGFFPSGQCRHFQLADGWAKVWCIRTEPGHTEHKTAAGLRWTPDTTTPRGFGLYADFQQRQYPGEDPSRYTVQESSLASDRRVWVGATNERAHLTEDEARTVRDALTEFLGDGAAHDAQVRAEALREAAEWKRQHNLGNSVWGGYLEQLARDKYRAGGDDMITIWLEDRADRIADSNHTNGNAK